MSKVIKILLSTVSAIILALIILPVVLALVLYLPSVQNGVVRRLTDYLSERAGTAITFDRIHLRLFNRVTVDGFYVEDYHRDTLFYAQQIVVPVSQLNPFSGKFALGAVRLEKPVFYLMQDSTGITNLRQVLSHFRREKPEVRKPFRLRAASLQVNDLDFKHLKLHRIDREGVNFTDLDVRDFFLRAHDIEVVDDSVSLAIDHISLREKSGLVINGLLSRHFTISGRGMYFDRLVLNTPESQVSMNYLNFGYKDWKDLGDFVEKVPLEGEVVNSTVSFRTIGYFAPGLRDWKSTLHNVSAVVSGPVAAMSGDLKLARINDTEVSTSFGIYGLPEIGKTRFSFDMPVLATNAADVEQIMADIARKPLPPAVARYLRPAGEIEFSGRFDGLISHFTADGILHTDLGSVDMNVDIKPLEEGKTGFEGHLGTPGFRAGRLLAVDKLGSVSLSADVSGALGGGDLRLDARASIPALGFNGYTYDSITLQGVFDNRKFTGNIRSDDPNILFAFDGELDFNEELPAYNFALDLQHADLYKLNLNRRDTVSILRTNVVAKGSGTTLDNMNGTVDIRRMSYINHIDTVRTGAIRLTARNSDRSKELAMYSAFADARFQGRSSYGRMISYFRNTLVNYLPSITAPGDMPGERTGGEPALRDTAGAAALPVAAQVLAEGAAAGADVSNYYIVRLDVKEANNVAGIFVPGLQLAQGTNLSFLFNPDLDVFSLTAHSDYIEQGNSYVSNLSVNGQNQGDSISLFVRADELYANGLFMPDFSILGGAKENRINLATRFNNRENNTYAMLSTVSTLGRNPFSGIPQLSLRFYPSTFTVGEQTWMIASRDIVMDSVQVRVDGFNIVNGSQWLSVSGTASRSPSDTLKLRLNHFDLTPLTQFTQQKGYRIDGIADGYLDMTSALRDGLLNARIRFDSMRVNDIPFRSTTFESTWDFADAAARLRLSDSERGDTIVLGAYRPRNKRFLAHVDLKNIDMSLLNPLLSGVVGDTRGTATARLVLNNPDQKLAINGEVEVQSLTTTVDFTQVPYTIANARGKVENNVLKIDPVRVYDPRGNSGQFELTFDASNFKNLAYDVRVRPERMLVFNTTAKDNDLFYGTVFASGAATIRGNKAGVNMDVVATTDNNSQFFLPLGNATVSEADFIVFETPEQRAVADSITTLRARRRLMAERLRERRNVRGNMDIKMALNVLPNAELRLSLDAEEDNVLNGRGNGTLNLHINPSDGIFSINGVYDITEGNYYFSLRNLISRTFIIAPGSTIQWTGDPMDAMLNVTAEYKLKASPAPLLRDNVAYRSNIPVECIIRLTDRLTQPTITFDVQVPNTDPELQAAIANAMNTQELVATQFIWLLAINSFYADNSAGGSNMNIGAMGGTVTGVEFLSSQLSSWLSTDRFSLVPKYRPKSELTSDEVGLAFSAELIKDRLTVEVDGSYDTGNNVTQTANTLTGDATLTLNLDRAGNLKARAFTRTVDRYDENQGLQESGLGITYKENFDNFRHLREIFRERFAFRRRREARRAARAAGEAERAAEEAAQGNGTGGATQAGAAAQGDPAARAAEASGSGATSPAGQ